MKTKAPIYLLPVLLAVLMFRTSDPDSEPRTTTTPLPTVTGEVGFPAGPLPEPNRSGPDAPIPPTREEIRRMVERAEADGYAIQPEDGQWTASNGRHGLSARWSEETGELRLESLDHRKAWDFSLQSRGEVADMSRADDKLVIRRPGMDEWFINDARGIEHGFDVPSPPARDGAEGFRVLLDLTTSLQPRIIEDDRSVEFTDGSGQAALYYRGLVVFDALRRPLPARMSIAAGGAPEEWELAIHVDDRGAVYPLIIDPVFTTNTQTMASNPAAANEWFGFGMSMSGHVLAVGVPNADGPNPGQTDIGAVDIFVYQEQFRLWERLKRIYPGSPLGAAAFGYSVDLDGDQLIVGAPGENHAGALSGAAYIFQRDQGGTDNWGQVAKLLPVTGEANAMFGASVGIDNEMAAIGSPQRTGAGMAMNAGAVFASFRDNNGSWSQPSAITGFVPAANDGYGRAVAVEGTRILAGAPLGQTVATPADAGVVVVHTYTFGIDGLPVGHSTAVVTDPNPSAMANFGSAISAQGLTMVVGSSNKTTSAGAGAGVVSIFRFNALTGWQWLAELQAPGGKSNDRFGSSVCLSGDTLAVGAPFADHSAGVTDTGAVHLFEATPVTNTSWTHVEILRRVQVESDFRHGSSIAMSGDMMAISTPFDDTGAFVDAGTVDTLVRRSGAWSAVRAPLPSTNGGIEAGHAVAVDRETSVVGMPSWVHAGIEAGAVSVRSENINGEQAWGIDVVIASPGAQAGERFGHSAAIAGNWMLVGAPHYDTGGIVDTGRAYLFRRTQAMGWTLHKTMDLPMVLPNGANYGAAVALTERWAIIGAPGMNHAFVFDRYEGGTDTWDISTILDESAGGGGFGSAIAIDGNELAISAPRRSGVSPPGEIPSTINGAGRVFVYQAASVAGETIWQAQKTLPTPNPDGSFGSLNGEFGASLAISQGLLMAGEPGYENHAGRVRLFGVNVGGGANWGEFPAIAVGSPQAGDRFGAAVAAGERWLFIGAPGRSNGGPTGVVYTLDRLRVNIPGTPLNSALFLPMAHVGDEFGFSLACSHHTLVAGAPGATNDFGIPDTGRHAIFVHQSSAWSALGGPQGSNANTGDLLGTSVAADRDFMVVGAPGDTVGGLASAGSVHLYQRSPLSSTGWSYVKMLFAGDTQIGAAFGSSVDVSGDTIVVGAPGWDGRGAVYVFQRNQGGADNWGQRKRVDLPAVSAGDEFGASVAIRDDILAVGSPGDNIPGLTDVGTVYVFGRHQGGTSNWGFLDDFRETVPASFDYFGQSLDVSEGRIAVGAPLADNEGNASGAAYIYGRITGLAEWVLLETLPNASGQANDRLGGSIALDGTLCVAGAIGENTHAFQSGAALVFRDTGGDATNWILQATLTVGDTENPVVMPDLVFGDAVAIHGDVVAVGAPGHDNGAVTNGGAVYLFQQNQTHARGWGMLSRLLADGTTNGAQMGAAVALTDGFLFAGAPGADQGAQTDAGYFFIFGTGGNAFQDWARAHFGDATVDNAGLAATLWGPNADPDGDGFPNGMEAFMDTDPETADPLRMKPTFTGGPDEGITFRYRQGKETHGAEGRVRWSRDLATWSGGEAEDLDDLLISTRVHRDESDHFIMEATISAEQLADEPRLFLRLEVNVP